MKKLSVTLVLLLGAVSVARADKRLDDAVAKSEELMRKGRAEDAVKALQKAASQDPGNAEAQVRLGRLLMRINQPGQRDEAGVAFARAAELAGSATGPIPALALSSLASYELLRASADKALAHAEAAVKAESNGNTLAVLARAQVRTGQVALGRETAQKALGAGATVAGQEALGEALLAAEKSDEAVAAYRKAAEADLGSVSAKVGLATALVEAGKAAEAVDIARAATEADPASAEASAIKGLAIAKSKPGSWGDAISDAQQGAFLDPKSPFVQYCKGQIFELNNDLDQALAAYRDAVKTDPRYAPAAVGVVFATWHKGNTDGALAAALELVKTVPGNGHLQLTIGELLLRKEKYADALPHLDAATKLLPRSPDAHYFAGLAASYQLKLDQAVTYFAKAVDLAPTNLDYRIAYGLALGRTNKHEDGIYQLKKVVDSPEYKGVDAWINLGYLYRTMSPRKPAEAADAYKRALTIDAKNSPAALGYALAVSQAERWDDAIAAFQNSAKIDPSLEAESAVQILRCIFMRDYRAKKSMDEADAAYQKAVALAGADNPTVEKVKKGIDKAKAGGAREQIEIEATVDINEQTRILASNQSTAAKLRAIAALKSLGRDGAVYIASYGNPVRQDDFDVCLAAIRALDSMKGAACPALREVKTIAFMEMPPPSPDAKKDEIAREMKLADVIRDAKVLNQKLQGICK